MPFGREQNRAYQLARYHRMRREAIARAGGKCVHCGDGSNGSNGSELGFEYASGCAPTTSSGGVELSKIWSCSKERIERELLRCVLLCRTCRTRKRSTERAETRGHGTITSYKYGCRCAECREVYNEYKRGWRARQAKEIEEANGGLVDICDASSRVDVTIDATIDDDDEEEPVRVEGAGTEGVRVGTNGKTRRSSTLRACG